MILQHKTQESEGVIGITVKLSSISTKLSRILLVVEDAVSYIASL